jgi:two-component system NtrC family response regulator
MALVNILAIDDEIVICKACSLILSDEDHRVNYCTTGKAGMDEIRQHGYDLILLDIKLPDLDGMEILKTIHETKTTLQVVVMTGHSTIQNAVEAMKLGAFDYLTKPFTDEVDDDGQECLEKKDYGGESLRKELFNRFSLKTLSGRSENHSGSTNREGGPDREHRFLWRAGPAKTICRGYSYL